MEQKSEEISAVLKMTFVIIFITSFISTVLGISIKAINEENKGLNYFLDNAKMVQPNFEKSLIIYTESTYKDIEYVHSIRPDDGSDYIDFISQIEEVGQKNSLNVVLKTLEKDAKAKDESGSNFIDYNIRFYSSRDQLITFLKDIEALSYYSKVLSLEYTTYQLPASLQSSETPNVSLTLRLYVK